MNKIKVEVGQYRAINKSALKGFFTLIVHPEGLTINDCQYFVKDGKRWFNFPQKTFTKKDGRPGYSDVLNYLDKEYLAKLKEAVMEALDKLPEVSNGQENIPQNSGNENPVQGNAPRLW